MSSESQLLVEIERLQSDEVSSPLKKLELLTVFSDTSLANNWSNALLKINIEKLNLFVYTDNLAAAEAIWHETFELAKLVGNQEDLIRVELASLYFNYPFNGVASVGEKHPYLLKKAEKIESPQLLGDIYEALATSDHNQDSSSNAIKYLLKAYKYYSLSGDSNKLAGVLSSLGSLYVDLGNYEMAIEYFANSLEAVEKTGNQFSKSVILFNIGEAHQRAGEIELAKQSLDQAKAISSDLNDDIGVAWANSSLAEIAVMQGEFETALSFYKEAQDKFQVTGDDLMYFSAKVGEVEAYSKMNRISEALALIKQLEPLREKIGSMYSKERYQNILAETLFAAENYKDAYLALKVVLEERERLREIEQAEEVQKFRIQFDSELKESQNQALEIENKLNQERLAQQQQLQILWAVILFLGAFVLVIVIWLLFRQVQHRNRFRDMALLDDLTQAPNRRSILTHASMVFSDAVKSERQVTVCLIDLDHFKQINDTLGHDVGDYVLVAFAKACKESIRRQDRFGRYGGEEWLLLLHDISPLEIKNIFERIRKSINDVDIEGLSSDYTITFSMGCAQFNKSIDSDIKELIKRADAMLYHAKQSGRDQFLID